MSSDTKSRGLRAQRQRRPLAQSGISLIEALLALVVMSLGMLAVAGVQATLRSNGDLSRQRAEAVRLAQEGLESWRNFVSLQSLVAQHDYTDIVGDGPTDVTPAGANATFTRTRTVAPDTPTGSPPVRTVSVTVSWTDRAGVVQQVQLFTAVAGVAPAVSASLSVPPNGGPSRQPGGRHVAIPKGAVNNNDGTSTFTPPQSSADSTVSVVFNNLTGVITSICTSDGSNPPVCTADRAQLVSGFLRMALPTSYPSPLVISDSDVLDPRSTLQELTTFLDTPSPRNLDLQLAYTSSSSSSTARTTTCFRDALLPPTVTAIEFFCIVRLYATDTVSKPTWTGALQFTSTSTVMASSPTETSASLLRACRYKPNPASHTNIAGPLTNQNLLLIQAGSGSAAQACPASATRPHQPSE